MAQFCSICGKSIRNMAGFCPHCSKPLLKESDALPLMTEAIAIEG